MANEIQLSMSVRVRNGNAEELFSAAGVQVDQQSQGSSGGILSIGTAAETISLGDVSSAGYAAFRNLSTATSGTAYIALGAYDGTAVQEFIHLRRGQPAVCPLKKNVTLAAVSYGTAQSLRYVVFAE